MSKYQTRPYLQRPRLKKSRPPAATKTASNTEKKNPVTAEDMIKDDDGLNARQKLFVRCYAASGNGAAAAVEAGYSKNTAVTLASKLLTNPHVKRAVEKAQQKRLRRLDITGDRTIEEIASVGFAQITPTDVKVSDKMSALTLLAKHAGLLVERHQVDQRSTLLNVSVTPADLADARRLVQEHLGASSPPLIEAKAEPDAGKGDEG